LDLGVGTGRTIPLLEPIASDYRAIDYLASMVEACRARHPHARVELGDARSLSAIPSKHFGLICFSFNGIDAISHEDRPRAFDEMRRVVRDDGAVMFSTLNISGPEFRQRPWAPEMPKSRSALRRTIMAARAWAGVPFDIVRWSQLFMRTERGPGWAVGPLSAHHYGVLAHFTTLERQLDELGAAGLARDVRVFDSETGEELESADDTSHSRWLHFIACPS
jgi:SAM-dependent methyltransferase